MQYSLHRKHWQLGIESAKSALVCVVKGYFVLIQPSEGCLLMMIAGTFAHSCLFHDLPLHRGKQKVSLPALRKRRAARICRAKAGDGDPDKGAASSVRAIHYLR